MALSGHQLPLDLAKRIPAVQRVRPVVPPKLTTGVRLKRDSEVHHMHRLMQIASPLRSAKRVRLQGAYSGIWQAGHMPKNALKSWCRDYEQSHELHAGYTRPASCRLTTP